MEKVSILIGNKNGKIAFWKVFANRVDAEKTRTEFEQYDSLNNIDDWEYFIQDEKVF